MPTSQMEVYSRVEPEFHWEKRRTEKTTVETLPLDPRHWSRSHVAQWLATTASRHNLTVHPDRFLMNGKALCLMTADMYLHRVPVGGKLLYRDFQIRLAKALYVSEVCGKISMQHK